MYIDLRVHDQRVLDKISYLRLTTYISNREWKKKGEQIDGIEIWENPNGIFLSVFPTNHIDYNDGLQDSLLKLANTSGRSQLSIVAELLGDTKISTLGKGEFVYWKEWGVDDGTAEISVVVYNGLKEKPFVDGDKMCVADEMSMDDL